MVVLLNSRPCFVVLILLAAFSCFSPRLCFGEDRITFSTPIKDSESKTLLSKSGVFRFGFFTPVNSTGRLRYVGIWYDKIPVQTVVWVANREAPINDTSGVVSISDDGNLVVTDGRNSLLWSTNVTVPVAPNETWVQLMENGNLRLQDNRNNGEILWESFKHPYSSMLPRMSLGINNGTGENTGLTSWRSYTDPSTGNYTVGLVAFPFPELLIWKNKVPQWRSGPWNGQVFIGLPDMDSLLNIDGFNLNNDNQGTVLLTFANDSFLYHFNLDPNGAIYQRDWSTSMNDWRVGVRFPSTDCDEYNRCGPYGSCNYREDPQCKCIKGFVPRNNTEWSLGNWISGCVRRAPLRCERVKNGSSNGGKEDWFLKVQKMKVPVNVQPSLANAQACPKVCLDNCSCTAYAYDQGIGCMLWSGSLVDMQSFLGSGIDLYIRLSHSELKAHSKRAVMITALVLGIVFVSAVCVLLACLKLKKRPGEPKKDRSVEQLLKRMEEVNSGDEAASNQVKLEELPLFEFQVLATATDDFSLRSKLGQGGFGPVYKGKLPEGQEIAVKRLSRASGQGLEELMNEVVVISKLQHRNLVKLLGCCIEGEERLLVYEYMPNKSLDAYLFDPLKQKILDWKTRLNIMEGICRGLLYLHRDSRLRIIHRDLKASNILLDDNLNPKISDFGLARVFRANEDEANTRRVVGTYGYMSPEYAMEGLFSEKSDVFSLGVILLEIISGRRNSYKKDNYPNLLAYVWTLWNEGEAASLADPSVFDESFEKEITKCVQISLLCVQEVANDRPNVSTVIWMLTTENMDLPEPKQPAFITRREKSEGESSDQSSQKESINDVSLTSVTGR
uniref:Receptor-like serine/threonine-protein kinase n=1 Tax=Brassica campestris TaxID=3711 RepID=M4DTM1_BRACM